MKIEKVKVSAIKNNPKNPRLIKDDKFFKLVKSVKEFPQMLELRPIVVNEDMIVLGGNMRLKACIEAGYKEVTIVKAKDLTPEQQKEFIIKDNVGFGEWDFDMLANEWNEDELNDWGIDLPVYNTDVNLDEFFEDDNSIEDKNKFKIVLEFSEEDYNKVIKAFNGFDESKEKVIFKLLDL
jgi:ParB-like chromosome segregation protein Spo0J